MSFTLLDLYGAIKIRRCADVVIVLVVTCIATSSQYSLQNIMSVIGRCGDSIKVIPHNGITCRIFMNETKENNFSHIIYFVISLVDLYGRK